MTSRTTNRITIPEYTGLTPVEDVTRRQFMASALAAALLIACSDDDEPVEPQATTRIIDTPRGLVEVPVLPQRIVAADPFTLQALDELGAPLVATATLAGGDRGRVSQKAAELPSIGTFGAWDFEAVVAANPDLIVGITQWHPETYERLAAIAPTVLVDNGAPTWRILFRNWGEAAGLADKATARFGAVDTRLAELRPQVRAAWPGGVTVSFLRVFDDLMRVYTSELENIPSIGLLTELGGVTFKGDTLGGPQDARWIDITLEGLRDADADILFYFVGGAGSVTGGISAIEQRLISSPLWNSLSVVQRGRAHKVDTGIWFDTYDFEGVDLILDDLFKYLT